MNTACITKNAYQMQFEQSSLSSMLFLFQFSHWKFEIQFRRGIWCDKVMHNV